MNEKMFLIYRAQKRKFILKLLLNKFRTRKDILFYFPRFHIFVQSTNLGIKKLKNSEKAPEVSEKEKKKRNNCSEKHKNKCFDKKIINRVKPQKFKYLISSNIPYLKSLIFLSFS